MFFYLFYLAVFLESTKTVVIVGENAFFICQSYGISSVSWIINGTRFTDSGLMNSFSISTPYLQDISYLNIPMAGIEYNNVTIQCEVTLNSGRTVLSKVIPMLVQGKMEKVHLACRVAFGFKFGEVEIAVHFFLFLSLLLSLH